MIGSYISYNGNAYKVLGYSSYDESISVELIEQKVPELCKNKQHISWIEMGRMWPELFFNNAQIIPNGELLYEKT